MEKLVSIIDTYLGFTDNMKQPIKSNKQDFMDKRFNYSSVIMSRKEFIISCILSGYEVEKEENLITYNTRNRKKNKPKTEYRLREKESNSYYLITKTEYDFFLFCKKNNLNSVGIIERYIAEDTAKRLETEKRERELAHAQAEREQKEREEKERVKKMIQEEILYLPEIEKEIMNKIFMSKFGRETDNRSYELIVMIHHFDNKICKDMIISWLHNDNVASIKTFECITGLKLPKTYKERIAYLKSITSRDFVGVKEYKERKKKDEVKTDVITEEFYIIELCKEGIQWTKVIAEPYTTHGIEFFIQHLPEKINISVARVGALILSGKNITEAKQRLNDLIEAKGKNKLLELIEKQLVRIEEQVGKNPRYQTG